ncbi:MAG TPA: DUF2911 domain-containing protein [Chitinophagales bacterium]|nr:DUF2911 domain-containing protein [Chitinophagales bacterium]
MLLTKTLRTATLGAALLVSQAAVAQTLKTPAASPKQTLEQDFALSTIKIEYSRPSAKGRTVFGELVPYGKMWRTGANQSTKITFGDDVTIDGKPLKAGTYALYTMPNKDSWDIMFYKDLKLGGDVADYKADQEALRIKAKPSSLGNMVETFTIGVNDITSTRAVVNIDWEKTRVQFPVTAEIDERIMKNIDLALASDSVPPYYTAANYYYENGKDMNKALEWANKAEAANPDAFWISHLKAKIQMKLNDYTGAITSAEKSLAKAREEKSDDFIKMNEKLIAEANQKKK